jgi:MFS transporter, PAT family, beta-lactamase induction signal transducer AmpG
VLLSPEPMQARPLPGAAEEEQAMAERLALRYPRWLAAVSRPGCMAPAVNPFVDFIVRYRWHALLILALISVYRISDVVMGVMANPFYRDMGFTKDEVAAVSKVYGWS